MEDTRIVGTCQFMCPESEIKEREKAGLVHVFERLEDQNYQRLTKSDARVLRGRGPQQRSARQVIQADKRKAVKEYTRPAAGVIKSTPSDLRPPSVLKKTVAYLCIKILTKTDRSFIEVYDFVFDRLRAVRQDLVIQRIQDESAIMILEAIVKFHLYAEYRFRYNVPSSYDPCINQKHLRDCLKTLLSFYELNNFRESTRPFFEALYCLGSPESYEVISRAFAIRREILQEASVFMNALSICLAIQYGNFYKFFQLLDELPPLLAALIVQRVPIIRLQALKAMTASYGVQTCKIPLDWIEEILCYPNSSKTEKDMLRIGGQIIQEEGEKFVKFSKSSPVQTNEEGIAVESDVKFTILTGLNNIEVVAIEQICPWGRYLTDC